MKHNSKGALCWIFFIVLIFGAFAALQYKFKFLGELPGPSEIMVGGRPAASPMPEVSKENAIIKKALEH